MRCEGPDQFLGMRVDFPGDFEVYTEYMLESCGTPYSHLHTVFIHMPSPLRDAGYNAVAAVRYRLFGKDDGSSCRRMTKAMKARFKE